MGLSKELLSRLEQGWPESFVGIFNFCIHSNEVQYEEMVPDEDSSSEFSGEGASTLEDEPEAILTCHIRESRCQQMSCTFELEDK